jgi:hypothetical protein
MARRWRWSTLQHSVNGLRLASAASTVHSPRRTSKTDPFPAGERFDQVIEDRTSCSTVYYVVDTLLLSKLSVVDRVFV